MGKLCYWLVVAAVDGCAVVMFYSAVQHTVVLALAEVCTFQEPL